MDRSRAVAFLVAGIAVAAIGVVLVLTGRQEARRTPIEEVASAPDPEPPPAVPEPEPPATARSRVPPPDPQALSSLITGFLGSRPTVGSSDDPESRLRVLVLDPWKRPVEDVKVVASSTGVAPRTLASVKGRGDRIDLLVPPGKPLRIEARSDEFFLPGVVELDLPEREEVTLVLAMKGGRLSGRIVASETGRPDSTARLGYWTGEEDDPDAGSATLSPEGEFDFLVPDGTVRLVATARRRGTAEVCQDLRPGEWRSGIEVALPRATLASLSGRVTDDLGMPVPGAQVRLDAVHKRESGITTVQGYLVGEVVADGGGRFLLGEAGKGAHALSVSASGLEPTGCVRVHLEEGSNAVDVALARAGTLRVRALLPDGSPMATGEILVSRGAIQVAVVHVFRRHAWREGSGLTSVVLSGAYRISGLRVEEGRVPFPLRSAAVPDSEGYHILEGLAWGEYQVNVDSDASSGRRSVHLDPGGTTSVEIRLTPKR